MHERSCQLATIDQIIEKADKIMAKDEENEPDLVGGPSRAREMIIAQSRRYKERKDAELRARPVFKELKRGAAEKAKKNESIEKQRIK